MPSGNPAADPAGLIAWNPSRQKPRARWVPASGSSTPPLAAIRPIVRAPSPASRGGDWRMPEGGAGSDSLTSAAQSSSTMSVWRRRGATCLPSGRAYVRILPPPPPPGLIEIPRVDPYAARLVRLAGPDAGLFEVDPYAARLVEVATVSPDAFMVDPYAARVIP